MQGKATHASEARSYRDPVVARGKVQCN